MDETIDDFELVEAVPFQKISSILQECKAQNNKLYRWLNTAKDRNNTANWALKRMEESRADQEEQLIKLKERERTVELEIATVHKEEVFRRQTLKEDAEESQQLLAKETEKTNKLKLLIEETKMALKKEEKELKKQLKLVDKTSWKFKDLKEVFEYYKDIVRARNRGHYLQVPELPTVTFNDNSDDEEFDEEDSEEEESDEKDGKKEGSKSTSAAEQ